MIPTPMLKKTISIAGMLAATAAFADSEREAVEKLTGPNQAQLSSMCVKVVPYSLSGRGESSAGKSRFHSFLIAGVSSYAKNEEGDCGYEDESGNCAKGFVKITSTAPISCTVPVSL